MAALAVAMARVATPVARERVELAPEPVHAGRAWASPVGIDPFQVPDAEVLALLESRSAALLASAHVQRVDAGFHAFRDITYYADSAGTDTLQQRTRVAGDVDGLPRHRRALRRHVRRARRRWRAAGSTSSATAPGTGTPSSRPCPSCWRRSRSRPSVEPGRYDLVLDPTNLWLTIHESVGHATELDRALGYEANYAGSSFATLDQLGTLQYGSPLMHVTGDRTAPYGLSTVGFDDEGVAAQSWDLVRDGTLVGYQLDRRMAAEHGFGRSNGCAFADSAVHVPVQRMPNVSLQPDPDGPGPRRA